MPSARQVIRTALVQSRVFGPGEQISDADIAECYLALNRMLDSWSLETLTCYAYLQDSGTLVPGQARYSIGLPAGDFPVERPTKLYSGQGAAYVQDTNGNNYPVDVIEADVWNSIGNRSQVNSNIPTDLWYDPQYPLGFMNLFPVPNIGWTLFWQSLRQLDKFPDLGSLLYFPPGYEKAIIDNLAVEVYPIYREDQEVPPRLMRPAAKSKANIKRANIREVIAIYDREIVSKTTPTYNIFRDR